MATKEVGRKRRCSFVNANKRRQFNGITWLQRRGEALRRDRDIIGLALINN